MTDSRSQFCPAGCTCAVANKCPPLPIELEGKSLNIFIAPKIEILVKN